VLVAAAAVGLLGCVDTDAAVFVDARIDSPSASLQMASLASGLSGGFSLNLHLGPRASGPSDVSLGNFSLKGANGTAVDALAVSATPPFPVSVPVDADVAVQLTFAADDNLIDNADVAAVCAPQGLQLVGALDGSLRGGTFSVTSDPFVVGGCP
jgi:hypothetical protein